MKILGTLILALLLHFLLGWAWTIVGGIVGGFWAGRHGWMVGMIGVGLSWLSLIAYSFVVAAPAVREMMYILGELVGGLPGFAILVLTWLIGLLLGTLGGLIGMQVRYLYDSWPRRETVSVR